MKSDVKSHRGLSPEWMLIATTVWWGLSFPLMKDWQNAGKSSAVGASLAGFTVIVLRMAIAVVVLALFQPRIVFAATRREHKAGLLLGSVTFVGWALQMLGMVYTTPAGSAFITSLSSVWVPLFAWLCFGIRVAGATVVGLTIGLLGTFVLSMGSMDQVHWGTGEALTVLCTLVFAVQILMLDRIGRGLNSAHITATYLATGGIASLGCAVALAWNAPGINAWLQWTCDTLQQPALLGSLLALSIFCTVFAFHWMNVFQPRISASRAALIYLLEPLFAALFSLAWGHDELTSYLLIGGLLILVGNIVAELPAWIRERRREKSRSAELP